MRKLIYLMGFIIAGHAGAQTLYLKPGKSTTITTKQDIDTIFLSDPAVASYQVISDRSFIVTGKGNGSATLNVLAKNDKLLVDDTVFVNSAYNDLIHTNNQIKMQFPHTDLRLVHVGQTYVLEGKAKSDSEVEAITRLAGEAMGMPVQVHTTTVGDIQNLQFLNHYDYPNIINDAKVEQATQINVKLTVVEVDKSLTQSLGINWSQAGTNLLKGFNGLHVTNTAFDATGASTIGFISAEGLSGFIHAIDNENEGKVLAEPNISMLNGGTAKINLGGEIAIPTRGTDNTPNVSYKNYGIRLTVGARVQPNHRIRIALDQEVSDIVPGGGDYPLISTKSTDSVFEVANGESFIIGGLYQSRKSQGVDKVPFLGDLPIIGSFFRQATHKQEDKELIVVATVNLVHPVATDKVVYPAFEDKNIMELFFNTNALNNAMERKEASDFLQQGGYIQ